MTIDHFTEQKPGDAVDSSRVMALLGPGSDSARSPHASKPSPGKTDDLQAPAGRNSILAYARLVEYLEANLAGLCSDTNGNAGGQ